MSSLVFTHDCAPTHSTDIIIKFLNNTIVAGVTSGRNEAAYLSPTTGSVVFRQDSDPELHKGTCNRHPIRTLVQTLYPFFINGDCEERFSVFRFLGTHISVDLSWTTNTTTVVKKEQQGLYILRILMKNNLEERLLVSLYRCIESVLESCISTCCPSCSAADRRAIQRMINTSQKSPAALCP